MVVTPIPFPNPLSTSNHVNGFVGLSILDIHASGITQYLSFYVLLLSLGMFLRRFDVVTCFSTTFYLMTEYCSTVWICYPCILSVVWLPVTMMVLGKHPAWNPSHEQSFLNGHTTCSDWRDVSKQDEQRCRKHSHNRACGVLASP